MGERSSSARVGEIVTKSGARGERREELWRINNRPHLSKASLMGCDRNLFTLRLVLNQTRGKWQWQAAAEGWGGGQVQQRKMAKVCHVTEVQQYTPRPPSCRAKGHLQGP